MTRTEFEEVPGKLEQDFQFLTMSAPFGNINFCTATIQTVCNI